MDTGSAEQRCDDGSIHESYREGSDYEAIDTDEFEQESLDEEKG